jgi:hypothetical protein
MKVTNSLKHVKLDMKYFTGNNCVLYKWQYNLKHIQLTIFIVSYIQNCTSVQNHTPTIFYLLKSFFIYTKNSYIFFYNTNI